MIKIKCCNDKCPGPGRIFPWNERSHLQAEGKLAQEGDDGAVSFVMQCKHCGTKNKIWVTKILTKDQVRGR